MNYQIKNILDRAGYEHLSPSRKNLIMCFLDYVDSGAFGNLDYDSVCRDIEDGDITDEEIIRNMNKIL